MAKIRSLIVILVIAITAPVFPFESQGNFAFMISQDSRFCLGCHDGTLASNINSQALSTMWENFRGETPKNFDLDWGHPVGIDYRLAQLRSKGRLKDPSILDPAVKLENGQVGCTTCHDPNSELRAKLVMSNAGSRLCYSCHNL